MVLGSEEGHLFHGVLQVDPDSGMVNVVESFKVVLQTPEYSSILEIKMTKIKDTFLILFISATMLY